MYETFNNLVSTYRLLNKQVKPSYKLVNEVKQHYNCPISCRIIEDMDLTKYGPYVRLLESYRYILLDARNDYRTAYREYNELEFQSIIYRDKNQPLPEEFIEHKWELLRQMKYATDMMEKMIEHIKFYHSKVFPPKWHRSILD